MGPIDGREERRDFVNCYEGGAPSYDDITEEEALSRYREVVPELSDDDYRRAAREAFSRMVPEERVELGRQLREQALQQGYDFPDRAVEGQDHHFQNPDYLAQITERVHREHPELLGSLLENGGSGLIGGMMGDGITGGEGVASDGGMMGNPIAKAAIAGIAAVGAKRLID